MTQPPKYHLQNEYIFSFKEDLIRYTRNFIFQEETLGILMQLDLYKLHLEVELFSVVFINQGHLCEKAMF